MINKFIAYITFEAKTALKIGSKSADFLQDSPIQKDWNGLPMILGTSITGVLRKEFEDEISNKIFGTGDLGSKTIISNALLLDENKEVNETLLLEKSKFLQNFIVLPIREHNAMNDKGVTKDTGKFDEEVIYKGTRFKFSIEMLNESEEEKIYFLQLLDFLSKNSFRIGAGSTKGFGQIKVKEITYDEFDTNSEKYIDLSSSLNTKLSKTHEIIKFDNENYTKYELKLTPNDFFMFGSGFGDDEADMTPVVEKVIDYDKKDLTEEKVLVPASSIKGAISHRTTYYYNLLNEIFIELDKTPYENVESIFGAKKDKYKEGFKGNILISDVYLDKTSSKDTKVFDHVSIDRFTGGAIDSALFQEKTIASNETFILEILLNKHNIKKECERKQEDFEKVEEAFEKTLKDITSGMLSLGGATAKGHGIFSGILLKDGKQI
ncbi:MULTISPECIES: RAMP superfamily CRISPR-associated protein [Aliarcobacter]|uniref:RAMP superfamily CRISPR-associated protein n=1 Tax=Aliarcobacter TaxID=2321111 RepID=UPI0010FDF672|nr:MULTISPECIES: RAMP superfamily CRISPR-associated protein [Aliarcobacter]MCT7606851.1 RAMP superfamily CRISPR-associated protein [Aliarcobacter butzleri]MCT7646386.1 RAMP superfamily CRISPR-associated protein [Aliarcobacter butzleri]TLT02801.1 CRISPR-associated protein [Aliarcobacter cibarius]